MTVVSVQRFDALDGGSGQFTGALSTRVGGTQPEDVIEQALTQIGFDADGNDVCTDLIQPGEEGTSCNDEEHELQPVRNLRESLSLQKDTIDRAAQQEGLPDREQTG